MGRRRSTACSAAAGRRVGTAPRARPPGGPPRGRRTERGVALLVVLSTIALVGSVVSDFQYNARVDVQLALNARDEVQAEYSALSALRVRSLLVKNARGVDQQLRQAAQTFGVSSDMLPPVGQLLEMLPVECAIMSAVMTAAGASEGEGDGEEGGIGFPGECTAVSKSEHAKISLPALGAVRPGDATQAQALLLGLLSDPKLERFFQTDDESGAHAESPQELVGAIVDWTDTDKVQSGKQVGDEDRHYAYLRDSYRAKNAPFDSVAELQLVHGVSDALYEVLKDQVSVYNVSAQIELATASDPTIGLGVCSVLTQPGFCGTLLTTPDFWTRLSYARTAGGMGFVPLTVAILRVALDTAPAIPYDVAKLGQVFTDRSSTTWYTVEAEGVLGNARKRIRAVFQIHEGYYYFRIE